MVKNHDPKNEMQDMLTPLDAEEAAKKITLRYERDS